MMKYYIIIAFLCLTTLSCVNNKRKKGTISTNKESENNYEQYARNEDSKHIDDYRVGKVDTIRIGKSHEIKTPEKAFYNKNNYNKFFIIEAGTYMIPHGIQISGNNITIVGEGQVNIFVNDSSDNVFILSGVRNAKIKNVTLKHLKNPFEEFTQCSGNVIWFDMCDSIQIENCIIDGCGAVGLFNFSAGRNIAIRNCTITNNSIGAIADSENNVWQNNIETCDFFQLHNNSIYNNGTLLLRKRRLYEICREVETIKLPIKIEYDSYSPGAYRLGNNYRIDKFKYHDSVYFPLFNDFKQGGDIYIYGMLPDTKEFIGFVYASVAANTDFYIITFDTLGALISNEKITDENRSLQEVMRQEHFSIDSTLKIIHTVCKVEYYDAQLENGDWATAYDTITYNRFGNIDWAGKINFQKNNTNE